MYQDKHVSGRNSQRKSRRRKTGVLFLSFLLLIVVAVGGTAAYLITHTPSVENRFTPSSVSCSTEEEFDGTIKKNVNVENTGDTDVYIRVKLVTYRVNDQGQPIGGTAEIESFTPGTNWCRYGDCYYYTLPVKPGETPVEALIGDTGITLKSYDDADGGKQVIEVMAEAIQSEPAEAVGEAWGVSISEGSVTAYTIGD